MSVQLKYLLPCSENVVSLVHLPVSMVVSSVSHVLASQRESRTMSVFYYCHSIWSVSMQIQEFNLIYFQNLLHTVSCNSFSRGCECTNTVCFFSWTIGTPPLCGTIFLSALSCYRDSNSSMIAFRLVFFWHRSCLNTVAKVT